MDPIDLELSELHAQFAEEKAAEEADRAERRHAYRMEVRERLRRGDLPDHLRQCVTCGRAILTFQHETACEEGKLYKNLIR